MEFKVSFLKGTLDIADVIPSEYYSNVNHEYTDTVTLILPQEIVVSGVDTLSARRNNSTIEVYSDPTKYNTCAMMNCLREQRDTLLKMTDWAVLPDVNLDEETKQELIDYRQQLRDITNSNIYPHQIVLPEHRLVKPPWKVNILS
jgi:hypothetical protein